MRAGWALVAAVLAVRVVAAARWGLLADEAYYWTWSRHLAAGYLDQPPLVAWLVAGGSALARGELGVRLLFAPMAAALLVLVPLGRDRPALAAALLGLPPLAAWTLFAVPDAPLLAAWAVALAGAAAGGRGWWLAGAAAGVAFEAKYTGALLPLLALASTRDERRDVGVGAALAAVLAAPHLAWSAAHGWSTLRFIASDGLGRGFAPAAWLGWPIVQAALVGPVFAGAAAVWLARGPGHDRVDRLAWWASAPVLAAFWAAAAFGEAEAHWPAPAWIGVAVGLSRASGRVARAFGLGAALAALTTIAAAVHVERPLIALQADPRWALGEGRALAAAAAPWVLPAPDEAARPVIAERYQEAAWLAFYLGLPPLWTPGCGRDDARRAWPEAAAPAAPAWFVRPARSGEDLCTDRAVVARHRLVGTDDRGVARGAWDLVEVGP